MTHSIAEVEVVTCLMQFKQFDIFMAEWIPEVVNKLI